MQLYVRDMFSSVTRRLKILKGFEAVTLAPGETKTVRFRLGPEHLALINRHMERVVEPGMFKITVGDFEGILEGLDKPALRY